MVYQKVPLPKLGVLQLIPSTDFVRLALEAATATKRPLP